MYSSFFVLDETSTFWFGGSSALAPNPGITVIAAATTNDGTNRATCDTGFYNTDANLSDPCQAIFTNFSDVCAATSTTASSIDTTSTTTVPGSSSSSSGEASSAASSFVGGSNFVCVASYTFFVTAAMSVLLPHSIGPNEQNTNTFGTLS